MSKKRKYIKVLTSNKNKVTIQILNECTINNVKNVKEELASTVDKLKALSIEVKDNTNIDLAGLQLLYSLKKEFEDSNRNITFLFNLNEDMKSILMNSGFEEFIKK